MVGFSTIGMGPNLFPCLESIAAFSSNDINFKEEMMQHGAISIIYVLQIFPFEGSGQPFLNHPLCCRPSLPPTNNSLQSMKYLLQSYITRTVTTPMIGQHMQQCGTQVLLLEFFTGRNDN